ncbi:MAG: 50S ribosome-binding GTPase [Planctomycetota bacterium]|nr:50S ribosome-binding GTPase [Planctomycetota bacterium]
MLAGPVNAGKSTLFNLWVGERRAVTSDEEGTTRDAIVARVSLGHHQIELIDTAGERGLELSERDLGGAQDAAAVEALGQALACDLRESADLCVWLVPPGGGGGDRGLPPEGALVIQSRCDVREHWPERGISVLAAPEQSLADVSAWVGEALGLPEGDPWTPGVGVPLSLDMAISLDAAFEAAPGGERGPLLDFALGPSPDPLPLP